MLGEKISEYLEKHHLSIRQFALAAGFAPEQINRIVNGVTTKPTKKTWLKIKAAFPDFETENINDHKKINTYDKMLAEAQEDTLRTMALYIKTLEETVSMKDKTIISLQRQIKDMQLIIEGMVKK